MWGGGRGIKGGGDGLGLEELMARYAGKHINTVGKILGLGSTKRLFFL